MFFFSFSMENAGEKRADGFTKEKYNGKFINIVRTPFIIHKLFHNPLAQTSFFFVDWLKGKVSFNFPFRSNISFGDWYNSKLIFCGCLQWRLIVTTWGSKKV